MYSMYSAEVFGDRRPAPVLWRRGLYLAVLTSCFTVVQVWAAVVVLATVRVSGPSAVALVLAMAGAGVGVVCCWRAVRRRDRERNATGIQYPV